MVFGQQEVHVNSSVNCLILDMPFCFVFDFIKSQPVPLVDS